MSIAKYLICILENSLRYLSQLYSPGKSSRIGWWRGNCKEAPPPLQMSGSDVNGAAYPPFRTRAQVHTRTPPAGGGGIYTATHILYSDLYCTLATANFRHGSIAPISTVFAVERERSLKNDQKYEFPGLFFARGSL
jgi:hypothetical protein